MAHLDDITGEEWDDEPKSETGVLTEIGNALGAGGEAMKDNQWVASGVDKMEDGGGHIWEGVKRFNPLGILEGIGNFLAGAVTFDGKKFGQGLRGMVNPVVGAVEVALGTVETAIGGGQAIAGGIAKAGAETAYAIGDAAGDLVKDDPEAKSQRDDAPTERAGFIPAPVTFKITPDPDETTIWKPLEAQSGPASAPQRKGGETEKPRIASNFNFSKKSREEANAALKDLESADKIDLKQISAVLRNIGVNGVDADKDGSLSKTELTQAKDLLQLAINTDKMNSSYDDPPLSTPRSGESQAKSHR